MLMMEHSTLAPKRQLGAAIVKKKGDARQHVGGVLRGGHPGTSDSPRRRQHYQRLQGARTRAWKSPLGNGPTERAAPVTQYAQGHVLQQRLHWTEGTHIWKPRPAPPGAGVQWQPGDQAEVR